MTIHTSSCARQRGRSQRRQWIIVALLALLIRPGFALAETTEEETSTTEWFQIELVIFTREQAPTTEYWDRNVALAYPPNWVELGDPNEPIILSEAPLETFFTGFSDSEFAGDTTAQPEGPEGSAARATPQTLMSSNASPAQPEASVPTEMPAASATEAAPTATEASDETVTGQTLDDLTPVEPLPLQRMPDLFSDPFYRLPQEERELTPLANDLKRKREYRLLFHEAWRQPVYGEDDAKSILIGAGKTYGKHHELEGSIKISLSRYLHLHTNLWFAEFIPNYGQEAENWPDLPPKPAPTTPAAWGEFSGLIDLGGEQPASQPILVNEYSKILEQPYVIQELYTLKQRRRMRSGELHYVDHPLLGVMAKITPYEVPQTQDEENQDGEISDRETNEANE